MISKRKETQLAGVLGIFVQRYSRKAQKGKDPNDRRYDHKIEQEMKRLDPADLSRLLSDDEDDTDEQAHTSTSHRR